jgi:hypothetical protein
MNAESWVSIGASVVSTGALGYIFRSAVRLEVLERLFADKKVTLDTVKTNQDSMDKRLILVESAIAGLNDVLPELRKLGTLADKLDIMFVNDRERINRLEDDVDKLREGK